MDLDEWIFASLKACNKNLTSHASDSEDTSSDVEARNERLITEMKNEIALQKTQISDQQDELGVLRSQQEKIALEMEEMKRQSHEIAMLRETVQKLLESHAGAATSSGIIPQCATDEGLDTCTGTVEWDNLEDTRSNIVFPGEGDNMDTMEDETSARRGRSSP